MSTIPSPHASHPAAAPPAKRELRIYSHSAIFYWWPVWAVGFLLAVLTLIDNHRMAIVPADSEVQADREVGAKKVDVLFSPRGKLPRDKEGDLVKPHLHMAQNKSLGVIFAVVLLIIVLITNTPMRGLWSVIALLFVVLVTVIFALLGWWDEILTYLSYLDIRINLGGYLFISGILALIWGFTVFVFDHRHYVVVTSGQVRVCLAIGAGETAYDTTGMTFQKRQDDLFRHWIVGLGSGDLIITAGNRQEIDFPNVLFIGTKIKEIESLLKEREVV